MPAHLLQRLSQPIASLRHIPVGPVDDPAVDVVVCGEAKSLWPPGDLTDVPLLGDMTVLLITAYAELRRSRFLPSGRPPPDLDQPLRKGGPLMGFRPRLRVLLLLAAASGLAAVVVPAVAGGSARAQITAIVAETNTGQTCDFGYPDVNVDFSTDVASWTVTTQCSENVANIGGRFGFATWMSNGAINCADPIIACGGEDLGSVNDTSILTLPGSADLIAGVSYGVESQIFVTAPAGQYFIQARVLIANPFSQCYAAGAPVGSGYAEYYCVLTTGPFSVPDPSNPDPPDPGPLPTYH
jgi:hypothetical protein